MGGNSQSRPTSTQCTSDVLSEDQKLLVAAISAMIDVKIDGAKLNPPLESSVSLFDHHLRTFCYGSIGEMNELNATFEVYIKYLTGKTTVCTVDRFKTVEELKDMIQEMENIPINRQRLIFTGTRLEDGKKLVDYGISSGSVLHMVLVSVEGDLNESLILNLSTLDRQHNYDFTKIDDGAKEFKRGGHKYVRPCGWKRFAINVTEKYSDTIWLRQTNEAGEWPVSYHGTGRNQDRTLAIEGYALTEEKAFPFSHGIYSTPDPKLAEKYSVKFSFNNANYLVILQNRLNPTTSKKISSETNGAAEYWISPSSADIRPYGICIRKA